MCNNRLLVLHHVLDKGICSSLSLAEWILFDLLLYSQESQELQSF